MNDRREAPHVSEEDLILHYYGESPAATTVEAHLTVCHACRDEFDRLREVLSFVDMQDVPEPPPSFERDVWARLEPQLTRERRTWLPEWLRLSPTRWAYAGGLAVLLVAAFIAGRFTRPQPVVSPPPETVAGDVTERVLVVAVVDHLDRSQMMLVELLNADFEGAGFADGAARARELVATNRLYRQTAEQAGDEATSDVLDDLGRTLLEIANTAQDAPREELEALRARIESRGLLFEVRVIHSEMQQRERQNVVPGSTS